MAAALRLDRTLEPRGPDPSDVGGLVPVQRAARELGRTRRTLQRWIRHGCPHTRRGRTVLFDVEAVRAWHDGEGLAALERAILWAWRGDAGRGFPMWRELALPEAETLALLLSIYEQASGGAELPAALRHAMSRLIALRQSSARRFPSGKQAS